ncbi:peptidoglycan DD-metalloendopeptidase family protein [Microbacterium sp.]|uniref:peptidoglycan DD-metalloendopeptidase family protein n=1 Tax=Microbacterium sp. TaxID=51671 RepID=UPI0035AEF2AE
MTPSRTALRSPAAVFAIAAVLALGPIPAQATTTDAAPPPLIDGVAADWVWPLSAFRLERAFEAPAHRYGAGHRGIDLRGDPDAAVRAPASGMIAFSGTVAGRGILTIDHGDGLVTTLEPVESELAAGALVERGQEVAVLALGGHAAAGALHFGVRLDGDYVNPMLLFGEVPRAVLLPCC